MILLSLAAAVGGILVGVIGFAMSYDTLSHVALNSWGFGERLAPWFPVGVDASIVAFLALDLYLVRKGTPWPVLRMAAHAMTGATIWFNASSQGSIRADPVRAGAHGAMPFLFVIGVEAARRLIIHKARLEAGTTSDRVPLHRWLLAPVKTPRFYRTMRLTGVTSYMEMIRREQELIAYELWLKRKYGGDLSLASEDELLPMTMARYGYTVAQALAMPDEQDQAAEARAEVAERRRLAAETRARIAQSDAVAEQLRADGRVEAVRAQVEGETGQARAHAKAQVTAAERVAQAEEEALETAVMAEAKARTVAAQRQEAEERKAKAEIDLEAAELECLAAEERRQAAEADRIAAAEAAAVETQAIAEARRATLEAEEATAETKKAVAEARRVTAEENRIADEERARQEAAIAAAEQSKKDAAEALRVAAETRRAAAEIELAAVEAEDTAKLRPRERAVRRVARMILTAHATNPDSASAEQLVSLAEIQAALDVSSSATASEYRQEAIELLASGYRP
ncbi:DUF2637 domain-containing protein [Kitasatospora paracochleata]|uniref:DUF2637 domain-containing protein n=2 Tax=Kitasatospora paracochleata TaxID=58354 RepID=A0ABT1J9C5_9ACTN|nr:DUF2637 domain-containing protein [Kitasatospora paracochleata]MCP2314047.1 hypothetical protein [Kitasatospora paracochleata]